MPLVWLAEAMQSLERNRNIVTAVKAVHPAAAAFTVAARTSVGLGVEKPVDRVLKAAWTIALHRLDEDPSSIEDLHAAARVYLFRGFPDEGMRLSIAAATYGGLGAGLPLYTASRAARLMGEVDLEMSLAEQCVERHCSLGYLVLGSRAARQGRHSEGVELLDRVTSRDRRRYFGVAVEAGDVARTVGVRQRDKTVRLAKQASEVLDA